MLVPLFTPGTRTLYRFEQVRESGAPEILAPAGWVRHVLHCPLPAWLLLAPSAGLALLSFHRRRRDQREAPRVAHDAEPVTEEIRAHLEGLRIRRAPRVTVTIGEGSPTSTRG